MEVSNFSYVFALAEIEKTQDSKTGSGCALFT